MIRAAIATKHKYGSVTLTPAQIARVEAISGQKFETTWLGKDNDAGEPHSLARDEAGNYTILEEHEKELEAQRQQSKEPLQ